MLAVAKPPQTRCVFDLEPRQHSCLPRQDARGHTQVLGLYARLRQPMQAPLQPGKLGAAPLRGA